jgi:hypothetical protein
MPDAGGKIKFVTGLEAKLLTAKKSVTERTVKTLANVSQKPLALPAYLLYHP